jgi:hypothetical protein
LKLQRASRLAASIALAAMLLSALAPAISHALALRRASATSFLLEVCTTSGPRRLVLALARSDASASDRATPIPADSPDGQGSAPSLDHCPFCLPIADRLGPPPAAYVHFFNAESGLARPDAQALFFATSVTLSPFPRGPPVSF